MASQLKIKAVIGLSGKIQNSITYTSDGKYILYPLGSFIVFKNIKTEKEAFFDGHSHLISCLTISKNGKRLASGQMQHHGVKVLIVIIINIFYILLIIISSLYS